MAYGRAGQVIDRFAPPVGRFPGPVPPQVSGQVIDRSPQLAGQVIDRAPQFAGQVIDRGRMPAIAGQVIDRAPVYGGQYQRPGLPPQFAGPGYAGMPPNAPLTAGLRNWPAWTGYGRR